MRLELLSTVGLRERFFAKVKRDKRSGCLLWFGSLGKNGYGQIGVGGRQGRPIGAHRVAFFLEHGHWPRPRCLHTCDNPPCCEAKHLYEGTPKRNMQDMVSRGRSYDGRLNRRGEKHHASKLTSDAVIEIRSSRGVSQQALADRFGVSQAVVSSVILRKTWRHVMP